MARLEKASLRAELDALKGQFERLCSDGKLAAEGRALFQALLMLFELLALLKAVPGPVILSGYPSALYDEQLADWRTLEVQVMNQAGVRTEKLWLNFTPDRLHWARYAGKNFTDRQRIKRKAESWASRYQAMPRAERLAVLAGLMAVEAEDA